MTQTGTVRGGSMMTSSPWQVVHIRVRAALPGASGSLSGGGAWPAPVDASAKNEVTARSGPDATSPETEA